MYWKPNNVSQTNFQKETAIIARFTRTNIGVPGSVGTSRTTKPSSSCDGIDASITPPAFSSHGQSLFVHLSSLRVYSQLAWGMHVREVLAASCMFLFHFDSIYKISNFPTSFLKFPPYLWYIPHLFCSAPQIESIEARLHCKKYLGSYSQIFGSHMNPYRVVPGSKFLLLRVPFASPDAYIIWPKSPLQSFAKFGNLSDQCLLWYNCLDAEKPQDVLNCLIMEWQRVLCGTYFVRRAPSPHQNGPESPYRKANGQIRLRIETRHYGCDYRWRLHNSHFPFFLKVY